MSNHSQDICTFTWLVQSVICRRMLLLNYTLDLVKKCTSLACICLLSSEWHQHFIKPEVLLSNLMVLTKVPINCNFRLPSSTFMMTLLGWRALVLWPLWLVSVYSIGTSKCSHYWFIWWLAAILLFANLNKTVTLLCFCLNWSFPNLSQQKFMLFLPMVVGILRTFLHGYYFYELTPCMTVAFVFFF